MEQAITIIFVWIIANTLAAIRFALFSGMNKKMVVFSLIMVNLILGGIYFVYQIGVENLNKSDLIITAIIVSAFMFYVNYKNHTRK